MEVTMYQGLLELNWNLLFSLITVLVLFLILSKFFFKKVHKVMEDREQKIQQQFDEAEQKNRDAEDLLKNYQEKLDGAEAERREILKKGRADAEKEARDIIDDANRQASERLNKADEEIEHDRLLAEERLKAEVSGLVKLATQKVLEKSVDDSAHDAIINEVIRQTGGGDGSESGK